MLALRIIGQAARRSFEGGKYGTNIGPTSLDQKPKTKDSRLKHEHTKSESMFGFVCLCDVHGERLSGCLSLRAIIVHSSSQPQRPGRRTWHKRTSLTLETRTTSYVRIEATCGKATSKNSNPITFYLRLAVFYVSQNQNRKKKMATRSSIALTWPSF